MAYMNRAIGVILLLAALALCPVNGYVYYVTPDVADCGTYEPCNTLNYYANSTDLRLTNSVFYFMPGTHPLRQSWVINNASNISLIPAPYSAHGEEVVVNCSGIPGRGITVTNSREVVLRAIQIIRCQQLLDGHDSTLSAALLFNSTTSITLSNLSVTFTRASSLSMTNCADFSIDRAIFSNADTNGIGLFENCSGKLTSIVTTNNLIGVHLSSNNLPNTFITVHLDRIISSNNLVEGLTVYSPANVTMCNSEFWKWGGLSMEADDRTGIYSINVQNCTFMDLLNGISIDVRKARSLELSVVSSYFSSRSNLARLSQISVDAGSLIQEGEHEVVVLIENVTMENFDISLSQAAPNTNSLVSLSSVQQVVISDVNIRNNTIGGLELYNSIAVFKASNSFINNSAVNGGGIALYGNTYVLMDGNSTLEIINNTAERFGGGMFILQESMTRELCVFQLGEPAPRIIFQGNRAGYTGSDVYGGNLSYCVQAGNLVIPPADLGLLINTSTCHQTEVSSDVKNLTFCDGDCINTMQTEKMLAAYPGVQLNVSVAAISQSGGLTQAFAEITYDDVFYHDQTDESDFINLTCTNIALDIRVKRTNTVGTINLTAADLYTLSPTKAPITIVVDILPCPAGFNLSSSNQTCVCADSIEKYAQCNITSQTISRYSNSWVFPTNESVMIFDPCPFDYCNDGTFPVDSPDDQCSYNRTGTLCGGCVQGYSLSLGSNQCLNCDNQFWKVPTILVGSAIAGVLLVISLIVLNLTISVGTINGLLFFVNVVKIYDSVLFQNNQCPALQFFISWLNLDLGIPTCFVDGMDACEKVGLQFLFPLYLFVLVLLIVSVCRCGQWPLFRSVPWMVKVSDKTTLLMGSKPIPVLATLLLFSYTKLVRTIILIYRKADVQVFESNGSISVYDITSKWYVNGNVNYLSGCHRILFAVGTAIVVPLIVLFTVFLLMFPLMEQYLTRLRFWTPFHLQLKPWYDAYGGPYKDRYRFWSGLLLLVRCLLVLVVTVSNDPSATLSILTWVCLILIPLVALLQVYKSFLLNVLEIVHLSCILAMVFFTTTPYGVQLYLILAIQACLFVVIVLFHVGQRIKSTRIKWTRFPVFARRKYVHIRSDSLVEEQVEATNENEDNSKEEVPIVSRSQLKFDELREPMLEDQSDT